MPVDLSARSTKQRSYGVDQRCFELKLITLSKRLCVNLPSISVSTLPSHVQLEEWRLPVFIISSKLIPGSIQTWSGIRLAPPGREPWLCTCHRITGFPYSSAYLAPVYDLILLWFAFPLPQEMRTLSPLPYGLVGTGKGRIEQSLLSCLFLAQPPLLVVAPLVPLANGWKPLLYLPNLWNHIAVTHWFIVYIL